MGQAGSGRVGGALEEATEQEKNIGVKVTNLKGIKNEELKIKSEAV